MAEELKPLIRRLSSKHYGFVIIGAGLLGIQNYTFSFMTVMPQRNKAFNENFINEKILQKHRLELGSDAHPPAFGYPDMGAGLYAKKLPYYDWFKFNCA